MVQVGLAESLPREITVGGTTGQAETIRDGPGPGRCRGYLITLIRYHRVLGMLSELATCLYALTATRDNGLWGPRRRQFLPKALSDVSVQPCGLIARVSGYCLSPRGKMVGLVPAARNVQVCLG